MNRPAQYATFVVLANLMINIAHGLAHRKLGISLSLPDSIFVAVVVLILPLAAMGLVWTSAKRFGLILLSLSMFGSFLFGLYHHFLVISSDHVRSQPPTPWGMTFVITAYALLFAEALGTYLGIHFFGTAKST